MPLYEFECRGCGKRFTRVMHVKDYHEPQCPLCTCVTDQVFDRPPAFALGMTPGKRSGFYDYDYGKKATWDLTVPGKIKELIKAGVIPPDPFDSVPPKRANPNDIDW